MARNETVINASMEDVFTVLADGRTYGHWVVGSSEIRDVDDNWPSIGSRFHHKVGIGPFKVADHTRVEDARPPHMLKLRARARPLGTAMVTVECYAHDQGTRVVMTETAADPLTGLVFNRFTDWLVKARNVESLRRLRDMVEGRGPAAEEAAAA